MTVSFLLFFLIPFGFCQPQVQSFQEPMQDSANPFAEVFLMDGRQKSQKQIYEVNGLIFVESPNRDWNTRYAIVTDFGGSVLKTKLIPDLNSPNEIREWVDDHLEIAHYKGVEIRKLPIPAKDGTQTSLFWIGNKSFPTADEAQDRILVVRDLVQSKGGNFEKLVKEASRYEPIIEEEEPIEVKANFQREEEIALKYLDYLDIGEKLYGPFQGVPTGEPILWQSFSESSWRQTNLEAKNYSDLVGYWTNRIVFKGLWAPFNTVDPYVEVTNALESNGVDFKSNMKLFAGLEWRPLARAAWLQNFRPLGDMAILDWIRSYRLYIQYGDRKNLKGEITGSSNHDLVWGAQIFYDWGISLPELNETPPRTVSDYLRRYAWGEYFGNYYVSMTNFGAEDDYDAVTANSSVLFGFKLPGIPMPENPIIDQLELWPYMKFEHVNNSSFSTPSSNQYFVAAGVRWMPFFNHRHEDNEWLFKTKLFAEYVGIGLVQHAKQDGEAPDAVRYDLRFGVNISSNRQ